MTQFELDSLAAQLTIAACTLKKAKADEYYSESNKAVELFFEVRKSLTDKLAREAR